MLHFNSFKAALIPSKKENKKFKPHIDFTSLLCCIYYASMGLQILK